MPEGDTVYRAAAHLHEALAGEVITRAELRVPAYSVAASSLIGHRITSVRPRGKHLLTAFDDGRVLHTHLGMDGTWRIEQPTARPRIAAHRLRARLDTSRATALGLELSIVELLTPEEASTRLDHLGPDLVGDDWNPERALTNIQAHAGREIAAALLDQRNLAGLGNEYVTELCFLRGVDPHTPVSQVRDLPRLIALAHRLITVNRDRVERTTTGNLRRGERSWVFQRDGQPCRRCGTRILRETHASGSESSTDPNAISRLSYRCPNCQPEAHNTPIMAPCDHSGDSPPQRPSPEPKRRHASDASTHATRDYRVERMTFHIS